MESNLNTLLNIEENGVLSFGGARMAIFDIEAGFWGLRRQMEALVGRQLADNALQQAGANAGTSFARTFIPEAGTEDVESAFRTAFRACVQAYDAAGFGLYPF